MVEMEIDGRTLESCENSQNLAQGPDLVSRVEYE